LSRSPSSRTDPAPPPLLIRGAELRGGAVADVRIADGRIVAIGALKPELGESTIDAAGGLLLPGLHDHHIHVAASAAAMASVSCGPPDVIDAAALARRLATPGAGWLRGTGYHESVAGMIDRDWIDAVAPERPVRVQHRSGRMWVFNTAGLDLLLGSGLAPPEGLERIGGRPTGRLFDEDRWARAALGGTMPDFAAIGAGLARLGVTGLTDMSPANDDAVAAHFAAEHRRGALPQRVLLAGQVALGAGGDAGVAIGPVKLHLHEEHLPPIEAMVATMRAAHEAGRAVAVHCVTEAELVIALAALAEAGSQPGDRIEHASVAPDHAVAAIANMGLAVVVQPHFIHERGDAYRDAIPREDWPALYRLRAFRDACVVMAGGSDAPFGRPDPWAAMAAAVARRTSSGAAIGVDEALSPEEALDLFLADPEALERTRAVEVGGPADLCLLNRPWHQARTTLDAGLVRMTMIAGTVWFARESPHDPPADCPEAPCPPHGGRPR